jgi:hypothetical protein
MENSSPQLNILKQYEFEKTPVLAGINTIGHMVALKPIVENMGLDWSAQLRVIKNDPNLYQLCHNIPATGADGKTREMICMTHTDFNNWLWSLSPKSENFKTDLWESYKKGLIIYILTMLKISLDELGKTQAITDSFKELRKLNNQKKELEMSYSENQSNGRSIKSEIQQVQRDIDAILSKNPNQLSLPI